MGQVAMGSTQATRLHHVHRASILSAMIFLFLKKKKILFTHEACSNPTWLIGVLIL